MMTALAFAAALPALFFPAEPLEAFGAFRNEPATNRAGLTEAATFTAEGQVVQAGGAS
jgi:hypothetical protein